LRSDLAVFGAVLFRMLERGTLENKAWCFCLGAHLKSSITVDLALSRTMPSASSSSSISCGT
jgi:hypothetical protein